ncbi:C40 family peptidase [Streptomyces endophyticus]|uniref:C40 family peptidase n=1 Tax=Streptomyces endophyticus TaxID=714166 RepID=A0ABU6F3P2_9ACTN|nr:C40 family peptidase [Streptomyces endophyticus]MEB8338025.1 C40 family peptidase [Streptomyces endophyticus]
MRAAGSLLGVTAAGIVLIAVVAGAGAGSLLAPFGANAPGAHALSDIPARYLTLYANAAATCPGLDWSVLAAVGKVESDHGRSPLPGVSSGANSAGARGPMQFLLPTFTGVIARHPALRQGPRAPSPYDPDDAIPAAAAYLCDSGARHGANITRALWTYNHDNAYVAQVLAQAEHYRHRTPSPAAARAIDYAQAQLGLPYTWGGNGPERGDAGFDCSGLTRASYAAAGMDLPRTAQQQYAAAHPLPSHAPLRPGDLVFYGTDRAHITHVGLYVSANRMIHAPGRNKPVRIAPYRYRGDNYVGAARPTLPTPLPELRGSPGGAAAVR